MGRSSVNCTTEGGGVCVITPAGEFEGEAAQAVREVLEAVAHSTARKTIIDCTRIAFTDSALLHVLLDARPAHRMILAGPLPRQLDVLLTRTGTTHLFVIADDLTAAHCL
ncbi:hypothetical protein BGK67_02245 [Streptomyces subrutilus]|uniref:STAS domain-containing protein n=1 Tax=Streptomyces subrutilus TaxID=36818 RepID=A0A1E5PLB8_9ACTN|nr:hypothetical protein BGK67_02245 [Streptomyces subrutilus]